jgi:hypothetical protein
MMTWSGFLFLELVYKSIRHSLKQHQIPTSNGRKHVSLEHRGHSAKYTMLKLNKSNAGKITYRIRLSSVSSGLNKSIISILGDWVQIEALYFEIRGHSRQLTT